MRPTRTKTGASVPPERTVRPAAPERQSPLEVDSFGHGAANESPEVVLPEPSVVLGTAPAVIQPDTVYAVAVSDGALHKVGDAWSEKGQLDLSQKPDAAYAPLHDVRAFARLRELGRAEFVVSDFNQVAERLPNSYEGAAVLLRLATACGISPSQVTFHGRSLEGVSARRSPPVPTFPAPEMEVPPPLPLGTETEPIWKGGGLPNRNWLADSAVRSVMDTLRARTPAGEPVTLPTERWPLPPRLWARARELGVERLPVPEWESFLAPQTFIERETLARLACAYGLDPREVQVAGEPLLGFRSPGWLLEPHAPSALGAKPANFTDTSVHISGLSDTAVTVTVDELVKRGGNFLQGHLWNQPAAVLDFWSRARELGDHRLPDPDLNAYASQLAPDDEGACRLLRAADAYGISPTSVRFGKAPLSSYRRPSLPLWKDLHRPLPGIEEAMAELEGMTGLNAVKVRAAEIRADLEMRPVSNALGVATSGLPSAHMEFRGNPGTGKSEVAKIFARVLHSLGRVEKNKYTELAAKDLVAGFIGQTSKLTTDMLEAGAGGVILLDEAYILGRGKNGAESFNQEAVAALILFMEKHRDDTVVILAGYSKEMDEFRRTNPGIAGRIAYTLNFEDYSDAELSQIIQKMLVQQNNLATPEVIDLAGREIGRRRGRKEFANGRDARNLVEAAVQRQRTRILQMAERAGGYLPMTGRTVRELEGEDFIPDAALTERKLSSALHKLGSLIGLEAVKKQVEGIVALAEENALNEAEGVPMQKPSLHALFRGKPGTGKTEVARIYAELLGGLGLLSDGRLSETDGAGILAMSLTELDETLDSARGGVLFIDEAYSLAKAGEIGALKLAKILKYMDDHRTDLVVVFAGYVADMDGLLAVNPGLRDRIPHFLDFNDYQDEELARILELQARSAQFYLAPELSAELAHKLGALRDNDQFANARTTRKLLEVARLSQATRLKQVREETGIPPNLQERLTYSREDFPLIALDTLITGN